MCTRAYGDPCPLSSQLQGQCHPRDDSGRGAHVREADVGGGGVGHAPTAQVAVWVRVGVPPAGGERGQSDQDGRGRGGWRRRGGRLQPVRVRCAGGGGAGGA